VNVVRWYARRNRKADHGTGSLLNVGQEAALEDKLALFVLLRGLICIVLGWQDGFMDQHQTLTWRDGDRCGY
jgi:hypothetical protein